MGDNEEIQLNQRMNNLASQLANLDLSDPRRADIINEITRLSLISASLKRQIKNG
jgi:hypothetical protein